MKNNKDIDSLSHTTWRCQYHVVFAPKYRPSWRSELFSSVNPPLMDSGSSARKQKARSSFCSEEQRTNALCMEESCLEQVWENSFSILRQFIAEHPPFLAGCGSQQFWSKLAGNPILLAGSKISANLISWLILVIGSKWKMRRSSFTWKNDLRIFLKGYPRQDSNLRSPP